MRFTTSTTLTYARSGEVVSRRGSSIVYTGYQWRGSSVRANGQEPLREVLFVERDWQQISGRWFTGDYDELGFDAHLYRVGNDPMILGMEPRALKAGAEGLCESSAPTYPRAFSHPRRWTWGPESPCNESCGPRGIWLRSSSTSTMTHLWGHETFPFPAHVVRRADSSMLHPSEPGVGNGARWWRPYAEGLRPVRGARLPSGHGRKDGDGRRRGSRRCRRHVELEEYSVTFDDDDIEFVGRIDARSGLFTPAPDGPNPERSGNRNNIGDVWVVASFTPPGGQGATPHRAPTGVHLG